MDVQDRIERAVYAHMLNGHDFFDAVALAEEEGAFEVEGCGGWAADVTVEGTTYELDSHWIMRRNYPR